MSSDPPVLREIGDLTATWLEEVLQAGLIAGLRAEPIGTGQMSERTAGSRSCSRTSRRRVRATR